MRSFMMICLIWIVSESIATAQNKMIHVSRTSSPIVIDGIEDVEWSKIKKMNIDFWGYGPQIPDADDFNAYFKLLWDSSYLYFIGFIHDDFLMTKQNCIDSHVEVWNVDSWELYWSPANSGLSNSSEMIMVRLPYANPENENPTPKIKNGFSDDGFIINDFVNAAIMPTEKGYIIEASLDLLVSAKATGRNQIGENDTLGFNAVASDIDGGSTRESIGGIIKGFVWNRATTMLRLVLQNKSNGSFRDLTIFPNPGSKQINFSGSSIKEIQNIKISNLQGTTLLKFSNPSMPLDISGLPSGFYMITVSSERSYRNFKFYKN